MAFGGKKPPWGALNFEKSLLIQNGIEVLPKILKSLYKHKSNLEQ